MKKTIVTALAVLLAGTGAVWAGENIQVKISGMVCSFCAQGIQKKFKARPEVEKVKVSLNDKNVALSLKDGRTLDDETVEKLIKDAGYDVMEIKREKS
ncbi:MAG: heavy-metal-associated domain-containing protein [Elusimicrobiota bacterium]